MIFANRRRRTAPGRFKLVGVTAAATIGFALAAAPITAHAETDVELWRSISSDVFGDKHKIAEATGAVKLDAPYRAHDAAIVPIGITIPAVYATRVRKLTLIVEKNPAPVVAAFKFGKAAGLGERRISTRIRVDMYSNVRAVIELDDGSLHMDTKFVKAAGGCSAPALKDMDAALANVGKMKLRTFETARSQLTEEAQVMVRHPNYSGMQMNQVTGYYIPAQYVEAMKVMKGDELVFDMVGGISLSEDPNIRFTYAAGGDAPLNVTVRDTDGKVFTAKTRRIGS